MNYYEKHIGDYIKDTVSLSMMEDGAYNRLIDQYYQSERPLPLDRKEIYREARASSAAERKAVDYVIGKFFDETPEGFIQKRIVAEIARYQDKQRKAKASADARWNKDKTGSDGNANASDSHDASGMRSHSGGNAHQSPDSSNQTPVLKTQEPDGSLSTSGKSPKVAALQQQIDGIPSGLTYTPPDCPHQKILALWAEMLPNAIQHNTWEGNRAVMLRTRWKSLAVEFKWADEAAGLLWLKRFFFWFRKSPFLMSQVPPSAGHKQFELSLEWLVNATNWAKVRDGLYHKPKEK